MTISGARVTEMRSVSSAQSNSTHVLLTTQFLSGGVKFTTSNLRVAGTLTGHKRVLLLCLLYTMVHRLIMKTAASSMARGRDGFGWCVSVSVECHPHVITAYML